MNPHSPCVKASFFLIKAWPATIPYFSAQIQHISRNNNTSHHPAPLSQRPTSRYLAILVDDGALSSCIVQLIREGELYGDYGILAWNDRGG